MIISALPDLKTLQCLVLASPSYHAMYARARETILTEFTIRQLESRNVNLFQPMGGLYFYHRKSSGGQIIAAVEACVRWIRRPKRFQLSVGLCIELLRVERAVLMSEEGSPLLLLDDEGARRRFEQRTLGVVLKMSIIIVDRQFSESEYEPWEKAGGTESNVLTISWQAY